MTHRELRSLKLSEAMRQLEERDRQRVLHVIPDRGRWVVRRERAKRATRIFSDKKKAIELARSLAQEGAGEVIVHREDGTMQEWQVFEQERLQTVYTYRQS